MSLPTQQHDIIRGFILEDINIIWDLTGKNIDHFKTVLIKLSDDSISSTEFSKYCDSLKGCEDLFLSTIKKLRKIAFANEETVETLNKQHQNLQASMFELKMEYTKVLSDIFDQLHASTSYLLSSDYQAETLPKPELIKEFLSISSESSTNTLEHKKQKIDIDSISSLIDEDEKILHDDIDQINQANYRRKKISGLMSEFIDETDVRQREQINDQIRALIMHTDTNSEIIDFSHFNLAGLDLSDLDLKNSNFSNALLNDANLNGADLSYAKFNGANFTGIKIDDETQFCDNDFCQVTVDRPSLSVLAKGAKGDNSEYDLKELIAARLDLSNLDLSEIDFSGSNFFASDFTNTDVCGCDFTDANLEEVINFDSPIQNPDRQIKVENPNDAILHRLVDHQKKQSDVKASSTTKPGLSFFPETT